MHDAAGWVMGDGGPLVLLQETTVPLWTGAAPGAGAGVESDYDAICRCPDGASVIRRHGRELMVLADSEWAGRFFPTPPGEVVVVQPFGCDEAIESLVRRVTATPPTETLRMTVQDRRLRLLPGADSGRDPLYGFAEAEVTPGAKVCEVWSLPEVQVVVIRPAEGTEPLVQSIASRP
jgi:hypothetical protein